MFKKIIFCYALLIIACEADAQFFRGIGLFVGGTTSSHRYVNGLQVDSFLFTHTTPAPSHRSAEYISYSGGFFAEFLRHEHIRWQTEFEYCTKGAVERPLLKPWPVERGEATKNIYRNIEWNNFLKVFFNEGYRGTPYLMIGARLDYNFTRKLTAYVPVANLVPKIKISPDVAAGYEFTSFGNWHLFTEVHYNPDLLKKKLDKVKFYGRMWELRVGLIYRPKGRAIDDCNAPRYHGSNY
jgi:hypothetical protein